MVHLDNQLSTNPRCPACPRRASFDVADGATSRLGGYTILYAAKRAAYSLNDDRYLKTKVGDPCSSENRPRRTTSLFKLYNLTLIPDPGFWVGGGWVLILFIISYIIASIWGSTENFLILPKWQGLSNNSPTLHLNPSIPFRIRPPIPFLACF